MIDGNNNLGYTSHIFPFSKQFGFPPGTCLDEDCEAFLLLFCVKSLHSSVWVWRTVVPGGSVSLLFTSQSPYRLPQTPPFCAATGRRSFFPPPIKVPAKRKNRRSEGCVQAGNCVSIIDALLDKTAGLLGSNTKAKGRKLVTDWSLWQQLNCFLLFLLAVIKKHAFAGWQSRHF